MMAWGPITVEGRAVVRRPSGSSTSISASPRPRLLPGDGDPAAARAAVQRRGHARRAARRRHRRAHGAARCGPTGTRSASASAPAASTPAAPRRGSPSSASSARSSRTRSTPTRGWRSIFRRLQLHAARDHRRGRARRRCRRRRGGRAPARDPRHGSGPAGLQRADDGRSASTSRWRAGGSRCCC